MAYLPDSATVAPVTDTISPLPPASPRGQKVVKMSDYIIEALARRFAAAVIAAAVIVVVLVTIGFVVGYLTGLP